MALDLLPYSLPVEAKEFVSSFAPDVVYSLLGSNCVMRLAMNIAAYARVPLVPHFMDDWPETLHSGSVLSPVLRRMMYSRLAEVTGRAPFALMIGDAMAREYSEKYGIVCHQFMNCVDETFFGDSAPTRAGDVVRFAYFGGLHFNRWKGLQEVGRSLEALSREGLKAEMAIYTHFKAAQEYAHLFPQGGLARIAGTLAPGDVPEAQRLADCLVHVESFDLRCRKYTRLSVSTKIPEYMASSRPILAYGPQEIASLAYVAENQAGIAVSAHSPDKLTHALRRLITDRDLRSRLGANGRAVAMRRHRAVTERERFRALLSYAVNGGH
jgi:glycosyltransferase involved in cell wall biosynthesis